VQRQQGGTPPLRPASRFPFALVVCLFRGVPSQAVWVFDCEGGWVEVGDAFPLQHLARGLFRVPRRSLAWPVGESRKVNTPGSVETSKRVELRRIRLIQELREAREGLLNINFATGTIDGVNGIFPPWDQVRVWLDKWSPTFRRLSAFLDGQVYIQGDIRNKLDGLEQETDAEIYNELRPVFVGFIDAALKRLDQKYQVKSLLEEYTTRVTDTKLAVLLNEFNVVKDVAPNHAAIGFRTILSLVIQEKAKRVNSTSRTATRTDLAPQPMIDGARNENIFTQDEQRLVDSFASTHRNIYDIVAHRPGANNGLLGHRVCTKGSSCISGLGLGLYISCEMINLHGGRMWLKSEPGEGMHMYFFASPRAASRAR